MGISASMRVEAQLTTGIWTDLTPDTNAVDGLHLRYGIDGNGPLDCVASPGEASFALKNHANNSGTQQGYYSPLHASKRAGWQHGIALQVVFSHGSDTAKSVTLIERTGTTANVSLTGHAWATDDYVTIAGADQAGYNGTYKITVLDPNNFTYEVAGSPATPATGTITARKAYVKHRGKIGVIDPDPGIAGAQLVRIVSYDGIADLLEADIREVTLQADKTEAELVSAILDALPADSQPVARDIDAGVDTFPWAFDDLGQGVKALGVIKDVTLSAFAFFVMRGDGTAMLQSRTTRATGASAFSFSDDMHGLGVPTDLSQVYNVVRVRIHPKLVSAAATDELSTLSTDATIEIAAGATVEVWTDYSDPDDRQVPIGGTAIVTALVGGTHYSANAAADGSGADLTGDITPTIDPFATTAKWTLTNGAAVTAYITVLKVIGKAVRDPGAQTYQASSTTSPRQRPITIDLKYQDDGVVAQSYATYVETQYASLASQASFLEFLANDEANFLTQALAREPGDVVTITETVTGLSADVVIQSVEFIVTPGPWIVCRWGLAPAAPFQPWLLGTTGRSELGETTRLGF